MGGRAFFGQLYAVRKLQNLSLLFTSLQPDMKGCDQGTPGLFMNTQSRHRRFLVGFEAPLLQKQILNLRPEAKCKLAGRARDGPAGASQLVRRKCL